MQAFQQRVVDEKQELDTKLEKLVQFINSDTFKLIDQLEQGRLKQQSMIMRDYSMILGSRIENFKSN